MIHKVTLASVVLLALTAVLVSPPLADAAEWQWSAPVASVTSPETGGAPQAFLWIPPACERVRAVVVGQHNMLEEGILEQSVLHFPLRNDQGAEQRIAFAPIPDQRAGTQSIKLKAGSDAGAQVHFYVREGPAELEGDALRLTAIPPHAKVPVKVTVVAWQWGRSIEPKLKTAAPVERTFSIGGP